MGEILGVTQGKLSVGARKGEVGRGIGGVRTRSGVVKARKKWISEKMERNCGKMRPVWGRESQSLGAVKLVAWEVSRIGETATVGSTAERSPKRTAWASPARTKREKRSNEWKGNSSFDSERRKGEFRANFKVGKRKSENTSTKCRLRKVAKRRENRGIAATFETIITGDPKTPIEGPNYGSRATGSNRDHGSAKSSQPRQNSTRTLTQNLVRTAATTSQITRT